MGDQRKRWMSSHAALLCSGLLVPWLLGAANVFAQSGDMLIDDVAGPDLISRLGTPWRGVSDRVMDGISEADVVRTRVDGRACLRLTGEVRLENDGGFIQASLDLAPDGGSLDASAYTGLRLLVQGNGEHYALHLRTPDNLRPWQSYRTQFTAGSAWETVELPFASFRPYRLEMPLDVRRLRRLGLVAIGRAFHADLAVAEIGFYR